jgi:formate hydrogenlyase transcriptional activator
MSAAELAFTNRATDIKSPHLLLVPEAPAPDATAERYEILSRVASTVSYCTLKDLASQLADLLRPLVDFDYLDVMVFDEDKTEALWRSTAAEQSPVIDDPVDETTTTWVKQYQRALCIGDRKRDGRFSAQTGTRQSQNLEFRSLYRLPLRTAHRALGIFSIASFQPDCCSEEQVRFLFSVAEQLSLSIAHALSVERCRLAQKELWGKNARLEMIMQVISRANSPQDFDDVWAEVACDIRKVLNAQLSFIALLESPNGTYRIEAIDVSSNCEIQGTESREVLAERLDKSRFFEGKSWTGRADFLEKIVSIRSEAKENAARMEVCVVPIVARGQTFGLLAVAKAEGQPFTEDEVSFASCVASQMALANEIVVVHRELQSSRNDSANEKVYQTDPIPSEPGFEEIVGKSAVLGQVLREVEIVAPTDSAVLILGETGTGKELIAQAIHNRSLRRDQPFVKVNCAAIPSGLLESELFGHEKGAFTGAVMRKAGRFEVADRGTIFLDEVGDIPLELQPKLLRVLQEHEFERLGSTRTQQVDVRVIAATHRDLRQMVANGQFRSDLYYRLKVFPLSLPALRERYEDIPALVRYYVDKYAKRLNRRIEEIPTRAMEAFCAYYWPGNVRELQNFIERAVILSPGPILRAPLSELNDETDQACSSTLSPAECKERERVMRAIRDCNWVISGPNGAATRLGVKRTTLTYRIRKLNIPTRPQLS